jgi:hypothetical protein
MHTGYGEVVFQPRHHPRYVLSSNFSSVLRIKDMRLMGLRNFAWHKGFPGLGINTTLICLQLIGIYPKAGLAISNTVSFLASSSKLCCTMMGIIPSMPGDFYM